MTETVTSKNGVPVRLTDERWAHIVEEHCELAGLREEVLEAVSAPECILAGHAGELLAVRHLDPRVGLVVIYRETTPEDGFVITAFLTTQLVKLQRRQQTWPPRT
jgi:hypothetical protein